MGDSCVHVAPLEAMLADERRFGARRMGNLVGSTGLSREVARRYCLWFVGADHGWKSEWGDGRWYPKKLEPWRFTTKQLADHLAGSSSPPDLRYSLHLQCKEIRFDGEPHPCGWTRCLILDLDNRRSAVQSLETRYTACCRLLGTPVALRSPGGGLHVIWPLREPVLLEGFVVRGSNGSRPVMVALLEAAGLVVAPGNVECLPTRSQTLRLPLGGTSVQLDPDSLQPLPLVGRAAEVARFVESVDHVAAHAPLDALALQAPTASVPTIRSQPMRWLGRARRQASGPANGQPDVQRLRTQGLYAGLSRHAAAMALARHWMLARGWQTARCVEALLEWTKHRTNGLSEEAVRLQRGGSVDSLRREYERICEGIERAIVAGHVLQYSERNGLEGKAFLTPAEADLVFATGGDWSRLAERYWAEVFLCCLIGFAKRHGTPGPEPPDAQGLVPAYVELSAVMMQQWPHGAGNAYKQRLERAASAGILSIERDYRRPCSGQAGRARTYRLLLDFERPPALPMSPWALLDATHALLQAGFRRAHPQQVEHALLAAARWTRTELNARYGKGCARRIGEIRAAYCAAEATTAPTERAA